MQAENDVQMFISHPLTPHHFQHPTEEEKDVPPLAMSFTESFSPPTPAKCDFPTKEELGDVFETYSKTFQLYFRCGDYVNSTREELIKEAEELECIYQTEHIHAPDLFNFKARYKATSVNEALKFYKEALSFDKQTKALIEKNHGRVWSIPRLRPYYRALHGEAISTKRRGKKFYKEALKKFKKLKKWDNLKKCDLNSCVIPHWGSEYIDTFIRRKKYALATDFLFDNESYGDCREDMNVSWVLDSALLQNLSCISRPEFCWNPKWFESESSYNFSGRGLEAKLLKAFVLCPDIIKCFKEFAVGAERPCWSYLQTAQDHWGSSPTQARIYAQCRLDIWKDHGADVWALKNFRTFGVLMHLKMHCGIPFVEKARVTNVFPQFMKYSFFKSCLTKDVFVNEKIDLEGNSLLHIIAKMGDLKHLNAFLKLKPKADVLNKHMETPLDVALRQDKDEEFLSALWRYCHHAFWISSSKKGPFCAEGAAQHGNFRALRHWFRLIKEGRPNPETEAQQDSDESDSDFDDEPPPLQDDEDSSSGDTDSESYDSPNTHKNEYEDDDDDDHKNPWGSRIRDIVASIGESLCRSTYMGCTQLYDVESIEKLEKYGHVSRRACECVRKHGVAPVDDFNITHIHGGKGVHSKNSDLFKCFELLRAHGYDPIKSPANRKTLKAHTALYKWAEKWPEVLKEEGNHYHRKRLADGMAKSETNLQRAKDKYKEAMQILLARGDAGDNELLAKIYYSYSLQLPDTSQKVIYLRLSIKADPSYIRALIAFAKALQKCGQTTEAKKCMRGALKHFQQFFSFFSKENKRAQEDILQLILTLSTSGVDTSTKESDDHKTRAKKDTDDALRKSIKQIATLEKLLEQNTEQERRHQASAKHLEKERRDQNDALKRLKLALQRAENEKQVISSSRDALGQKVSSLEQNARCLDDAVSEETEKAAQNMRQFKRQLSEKDSLLNILEKEKKQLKTKVGKQKLQQIRSDENRQKEKERMKKFNKEFADSKSKLRALQPRHETLRNRKRVLETQLSEEKEVQEELAAKLKEKENVMKGQQKKYKEDKVILEKERQNQLDGKLKYERLYRQVKAKLDDEDEEDDQMLCCLCFENRKSHAFLPCGHVYLCGNCYSNTQMGDTCPLCRSKYVSVQKIYF